VREHAPQAIDRFGGKARSEQRNVALEVAPAEVAPPGRARRILGCKQALRKSAPHPERLDPERFRRDLRGIHGGEFDVRHATGEGLRSLAHEFEGSRSEEEEMARAFAAAAALVDDAPQHLEQARRAADLVDDDELARLGP
jgi:hypothetical protein